MPSARIAIACGITAFAFSLTGCDDGRPPLAPVTGSVTLDGKPFPTAEVMFMVPGGRPARGETDEEGRFVLTTFEKGDGCMIGKAQVLVQKQGHYYDKQGKSVITYAIPKKYGIPGQSGLDVEVVAGGENDFALELTSR